MVKGVVNPDSPNADYEVDGLSGATFTRITDSAGSEASAAISRDGKNIACLSDRGGRLDIWVIPVGTGQPYNLTDGLVVGLNSNLRSVGFSHDGSARTAAGGPAGSGAPCGNRIGHQPPGTQRPPAPAGTESRPDR